MEITVTCGGVGSNKTNGLIDLVDLFKGSNHVNLFVVKPSKDTRFSTEAEIESHTGRKTPCILVEDLDGLEELIENSDRDPSKPTVVIADEWQFFDGDAPKFFRNNVLKDVSMFLYGLDLDSAGETWPTMNAAMGYADIIVKKTHGSKKHKFSQKLVCNGNKEDVSKNFKLVTAENWTPMV